LQRVWRALTREEKGKDGVQVVEDSIKPPPSRSHIITKTELTMTSEGYIILKGTAESGTQSEMAFDIEDIRVVAKRLLALCDIAEGEADDNPVRSADS